MNNMKSVAFHNLGCKVNEYEMDYMQQKLQEKGYTIVPFDTKADIYIVNTCTVTNMADRKSRQMLHRAKTLNPEAVVVAVGCYVQTGKEEALKDLSIDLAIGNNRKKDLPIILEQYFKGETPEGQTIIDIGSEQEYERMEITKTAEHTRAFIKVQDGCNQFCSYCIIPYARGRIRYHEKDEVIREVRGLAKAGYKEVVLTGIHLSSYGMTKGNDLNESKLADLIEAVNRIEGIERIRLGSLEPRIITEEFAARLADCEKLCPHFHLSLQSGSDEVLRRMNRKYTTGEYYEKVCILRNYFHEPAITTDVIVGFPGETEEEFEQTRQFLHKVQFYEMHIFKYSRRNGTPAATMPDQIPEQVKGVRSNLLIQAGNEMSRAYRAKFLAQEVEVLFEEPKEIKGEIYQTGYTKEYIRVAKKTTQTCTGTIQKGIPDTFLDNDILCFKA